jgi:hypothetical protein
VLAAIFGGEFAEGLFKRVAVAIVASRAEKEHAALEAVAALFMKGYLAEMNTRPQTIGYGSTDPVGLAAWMLDHDTDSYEKISHAFLDGQPAGNLTRDRIVDNLTLYWLTNTATSAARLYWENAQSIVAALASGQKPPSSRSRSPSRRSPTRSSRPRAAGPRRSTPTSPTSTRPSGAATSPPGKSPSCSAKRSGRRSGRSAEPIDRGEGTGHMTTAATSTDTALRPFHVDIPEEAIDDLRRRIAAWRPPEREPVDDQSQGVQLATVQELADHWSTEWDWRRCEAKLNALDQFVTAIDGSTSTSSTSGRGTRTRCR